MLDQLHSPPNTSEAGADAFPASEWLAPNTRLPSEATGYASAVRLVRQVGSAAPLRRALAAVAGEFVRRKAWERLGFARLRDYASERVGVSARQLQQLARVDGALAELPEIDAALSSGRVSWTQARLLCRVATRENEGAWIALASESTTHALAREVRAVDGRALEKGGLQATRQAAEPRETVWLRCSPQTRSKWGFARQLAQRVAGERLPVWAVAEAVAAEVVSASGLDEAAQLPPEAPMRSDDDVHAPQGPAEPCDPLLRVARGVAPGSMPFLDALTLDLAGCDAFELDARLARALRLEAEQLRSLGPLLLEMVGARGHRDAGYGSLDTFVREELGMAPSRVRALLRLERLGSCCPEFGRAWRAGLLSWTHADALARLLENEASLCWRNAWIERAQVVTVRRLADDVEAALASGHFDPGPLPTGRHALEEIEKLQTGARARASERGPASEEIRFRAPSEVAQLFEAVLATTQRRIEAQTGRPSSEDEALDAMLEHVFEAWGRYRTLPRKYRLFARDGWRCTAPGCTSYSNLHGHHIRPRSQGGNDDESNLTTLCAYHHLRGVHGGTLRCTGRAPGKLRFELGVRAGRKPLLAYASGDVVLAG